MEGPSQTLPLRATPELGLAETCDPGRKALLVLGMSRSGTSYLTNALHTLGAALPRDLMAAGPGNPLGHFEPLQLVALNDSMLESAGLSWNDPRPFPAGWFRSSDAYAFQREIVARLTRSFGGEPLFALKDPRICRLLPLYIDALDVLAVEPLVILQVRPVAEVARSLAERDQFSPALAELLWIRSVTEAEWQSRNCRRVWVSMADATVDWPRTARRIGESLRLAWPLDPDWDIDPGARPRRSHRVTPASNHTPGALSVAAWAAVENGLRGDEAAARSGFDHIRWMLDDFDRLHAACAVSRDWMHPLARRMMSGRLGGIARAALRRY